MRRAPRAVALGAALLACARSVAAWQGAAGPNYYLGDNELSIASLAAYPNAVCNDGSPAAYYYSQGTDPSLWLVYLEGGAWPRAPAWRAPVCALRRGAACRAKAAGHRPRHALRLTP